MTITAQHDAGFRLTRRCVARGRASRRGVAVVLVLGMIAMTLAVSYALVRAQTEVARGTSNGELRSEARQAAWTGLSAALRRMSQSSGWTGADSTFTGTINTRQTYAVTYTTGDERLTPDSPEAGDWPFRVTITSTGYAVDPQAATTTTMYKVEAVARLVPRGTSANPAPWSTMQSFVVYQTSTDDVNLQIPFRIDGAARFQGSLSNFAVTYPSPSSARSRYLSDLNAMRTGGYADCRPFTGPLTLPNSATTSTVRNLITGNLGVTINNASGSNTSNWNHPGTISGYQLYPGGKTFTVPTLPASVSNSTYQADPRTNPAGLFFRSGDVTLSGSASVVGTIITSGKVIVGGTGVSLRPASLPAVDGSSAVVRLPAIVAAQDVQVNANSTTTVTGTVATFAKLNAPAGAQATTFDLRGRLICRAMEIGNRSEFNVGSGWWSLIWSFFPDQENDADGTRYFPVYCQGWGMAYTPRITIAAAAGPATQEEWFTAGSPVYNVGSGDAGLRWSVLRFRELP
ncbi:MAG: hypothetical protein JNK76_09505 [Planctomycetales bacterium]|nr:hypothetical protein [Planctomycetales bacterium]MBN8629145.1 hypothetical protein [Planctomycetota bacterium]